MRIRLLIYLSYASYAPALFCAMAYSQRTGLPIKHGGFSDPWAHAWQEEEIQDVVPLSFYPDFKNFPVTAQPKKASLMPYYPVTEANKITKNSAYRIRQYIRSQREKIKNQLRDLQKGTQNKVFRCPVKLYSSDLTRFVICNTYGDINLYNHEKELERLVGVTAQKYFSLLLPEPYDELIPVNLQEPAQWIEIDDKDQLSITTNTGQYRIDMRDGSVVDLENISALPTVALSPEKQGPSLLARMSNAARSWVHQHLTQD